MSFLNHTPSKQYAFTKGWNQVPNGLTRAVRLEIMEVLDLTRESFYRRLNGLVEPKVSEAAAIERVFAKYGITEIWGA